MNLIHPFKIDIYPVFYMKEPISYYAFSKILLGKSGPFGAVDMESCLLNADIGL